MDYDELVRMAIQYQRMSSQTVKPNPVVTDQRYIGVISPNKIISNNNNYVYFILDGVFEVSNNSAVDNCELVKWDSQRLSTAVTRIWNSEREANGVTGNQFRMFEEWVPYCLQVLILNGAPSVSYEFYALRFDFT